MSRETRSALNARIARSSRNQANCWKTMYTPPSQPRSFSENAAAATPQPRKRRASVASK